MPCYRCGLRQSDPVRGPSPWKRGVRAGRQVLICPDCQRDRDWTAELDRCPHCDATTLHRVLEETTCRACGHTGSSRPVASSGTPEPAAAAGLAEDVAAAITRVLRGGVH
ncbi:MAG: hypothetical protein ABJC62_14375 [Frankiaceae bacterium]|jgi:hypothetical protein